MLGYIRDIPWQTKRKRFMAYFDGGCKFFPTRRAAQDWIDEMYSARSHRSE